VIFPAHRSFDFALLQQGWSDFAMVGLNDQRLNEWIDVVSADYHRNIDTALRRLRRLEFQRPGLVLSSHLDSMTQGLAHSAYLRHQSELSGADRLPVCFVDDVDAPSTALPEWLAENRPDVVIGDGGKLLRVMCAERGIAFVRVNGGSDESDGSIDPARAEIASVAVDCVVEKMRRYERGLRESTRLHLIKGSWEERALVRREIETIVA
jgi:hypothetical protein